MKILHVEDNADLQRLYARIITKTDTDHPSSHTVISVSDGSQALPTALAEKPDLILMDVMMPIMNGIDALILLKGNDETKDIPVIMLSAFEDDDFLTRAMSAGAVRYVVKDNISVTELVPMIEETYATSQTKKQ